MNEILSRVTVMCNFILGMDITCNKYTVVNYLLRYSLRVPTPKYTDAASFGRLYSPAPHPFGMSDRVDALCTHLYRILCRALTGIIYENS
uniref:Uncharacterized protein n=1 Tax=Pararge aegeria TaxID=116150 RepID=S4PZC4_9NEOP